MYAFLSFLSQFCLLAVLPCHTLNGGANQDPYNSFSFASVYVRLIVV